MHPNTSAIRAIRTGLALLAGLLPLAAVAQNSFGPLRYDFVAANLVVPELDELGVEIVGSTAVTEKLVVFGSYFDYEPGRRVSRESLQIGVGRIWNLRPNIDFVGSLSYGDNEISTPGRRRADEDGIIVGAKIRGLPTRNLELEGGVLLDNSTGSNTETVLELGLQYFRAANWSFGGRVRSDDDDTVLFAGIRAYFGASRRSSGRR